MKIFTSRFPDQGEQGGGMIVIAETLEQAQEKLRQDFLDVNSEEEKDLYSWQEECLETLEESGTIGKDDVISFFT